MIKANIAYLITAYKEPEQVARLLTSILTDSDAALVHFDRIVKAEKFQSWKRVIEQKCSGKNVKVVSESRCKYGSFGQIDVLISALKYFEDNFDYDYFIDFTGDSYPLRTPEVIKKALGGQDCSFIEFFKLPYKEWYMGGLNRLNNRYYFIPRPSYPYVWQFSLPRLRKSLPCGLEPYGGHGGLCLRRSHARYVTEFVEKKPQVVSFFKRVYAPDELFFETILLNSPFKSEIYNGSLLYVDFSEGTIHPKVLTKEDFGKLKASGKFFARKFDVNTGNYMLDLIDREIESLNQQPPFFCSHFVGELNE
jgi:hypothetical protein